MLFNVCNCKFTKYFLLVLATSFYFFNLNAQESLLGKSAPFFSLNDISHKNYSLDKLGGKVVLLNFWASWCGPCREELPVLRALYSKLKSNKLSPVFLSVNVDDSSSLASALELLKTFKLPFPSLFDSNGDVVSKYSPSGMIPVTVIIDAKGVIKGEYSGYELGREVDMEKLIVELSKGKSRSSSPKLGKSAKK